MFVGKEQTHSSAFSGFPAALLFPLLIVLSPVTLPLLSLCMIKFGSFPRRISPELWSSGEEWEKMAHNWRGSHF